MRNLFLACTVLSLAFSSCTDKGEPVEQSALQMEIIPEVASQPAQSRAAKSVWSSGDVLGWYLCDGENSLTYLKYSFMNKKLSYDGNAWSLEVQPNLAGNTGTVFAYYPYKNSYSVDFNAIAIETASQTDYMWGMATGFTSATPSKTLVMNHALCQIAVKVVRGTYPYAGEVTSAKINSSNLGTTGTINVPTGRVTLLGGSDTDIELDGGTQTITPTGVIYHLMMIQGGTAAAPILKLTMDDHTYTLTLPEINPIAGVRYLYTVNANSSNIELPDNGEGDNVVVMTPWEETTSGTVPFE